MQSWPESESWTVDHFASEMLEVMETESLVEKTLRGNENSLLPLYLPACKL